VANLSETIRGKLKNLEETIGYIDKKIKEEEQGRITL
jgi:hypothetical protein